MMSLSQRSQCGRNTEVSREDLAVASIAWGFTIGFGFLTTWAAMKQTALVHRRYGTSRLNSPYIWMIWLEILVSLLLGLTCWLHLFGVIPPSFTFFFFVVTCWSLQIQFLLQIIINRVSILLPCRRKARIIKYSLAALVTLVNISMYCVCKFFKPFRSILAYLTIISLWIPGRLEISNRWISINMIWDYCEKVIYFVVDACLNLYFMYIIQENLVRKGLVKYDRLLRFNKCIIVFSLSMDCLIIGTMSLKNSDVHIQFHPLAYMVKLNIEMAMTELMTKVSCSPNPSSGAPRPSKGASFIRSDPNMYFRGGSPADKQMYNQFHSTKEVVWREKPTFADLILDHCTDMGSESHPECKFNLTREVHIQTENRRSLQERPRSMESDHDGTEHVIAAFEGRLRKLRAKDTVDAISIQSSRIIPFEEDLGSQTKIWGP